MSEHNLPETMDRAALVKIIQSTTQDVFSTMLMMEAQTSSVNSGGGSPVDGETGPGLVDGVVGIIGIAGTWVGTGIIMCSPELACKASSAMMMAEYDTVNGDVLDAMGEITNMIIGNIKTALEETHGQMGISVPTVVYGRNFATRTVSRGEWVVVSFLAAGHGLEIHLNLALNPRPDKVTHGFIRTEPVLA
jgi:chemotaxis protein CheX